MAGKEHKRQKALAKKRKREKEVRKARNAANNLSARDLVLQMSRGAWQGCFESGMNGMSHIICVRQTQSGFGASIFLLDEYCLGIKDADVIRDISMESVRESVGQRGSREVSPAYALKKIESLIEWARSIGFEPHPEAALAMQIFRGVNADDCEESFSFGRAEDGKPMFISGPYDSPERIRSVLETLTKLGPGNFHYLFGAGDFQLANAFEVDGLSYDREDDDDEDDFDGDEDDDNLEDLRFDERRNAQIVEGEVVGRDSNPS